MINTPQEDIAIPEKLQKAIENSRNIVTVNEAEATRLRGLVVSYQYSIAQLHNQETEIQEKINSLKAMLDNLFARENQLESNLLSKTQALETVNNDLNLIQLEIEKNKEHIESSTKKIEEDLKKLEDDKYTVFEREKACELREIEVSKKEEKIRTYFN